MCYFGPPPSGLQNLLTGEVSTPLFCGNVSWHGNQLLKQNFIGWESESGVIGLFGKLPPPEERVVTEPGFYYVCGSGSYYSYFDGKKWHCSRDDWGPPSTEYWKETLGYHPCFYTYKFFYPPHDPCKEFSPYNAYKI